MQKRMIYSSALDSSFIFFKKKKGFLKFVKKSSLEGHDIFESK